MTAPAKITNVILVTFDSLSAKDMSLYGYRRCTTPFIDSFASESYVFEHMYANCNSTVPSLASIITGRYPFDHGYDRARSLLTGGSGAKDLDHVLRSNGYKTAAIIGTNAGYFWLNSLAKAGRGLMSGLLGGRFDGRGVSGATASLNATFRKTLEVLGAARGPFFLWLHLYPPHEPYLPSRSFRGAFTKERVFDALRSQRPYLNRFYPETSQPAIDMLRGRYNEHLLEVDHKFGGFLETVRARGLFETSMIAVTADHGEMFEKGYQGHRGPLLYDPLLHIPFILRLPDGAPGRRVGASAEQVDIAPTILDLLGIDIPAHMQGESLVAAMLNGGGSAKPKFSVSAPYRAARRGSYRRSVSVVCKGHKLILDRPSGACELYDLVRDPEEDTDLSAREPDMARDLRGMILERFATDDACFRRPLPEPS